jgi:Apea-like HEPN
MRKLITKFMLTNVGLGWAKDTVPEEVKKNARVEVGGVSSNYLYEVDFIQLSNFLFNEYRTLDLNALAKKISEAEGDSIPLKEISDFIPLSNWSRYFKPYVDCEAQYLQVRWEKLYKLRCKIAHNNSFTISDYDQAAALYAEVKGKLEKAIESLDEIAVPEEEREELAERAASQSNIMLAAYLAKWRLVEDLVDKVLRSNGCYADVSVPNKKKTLFGRHAELIKHGLISSSDYKALREVLAVRNALVHDNSQYFAEIDMVWYMKRLDELIELLASLIKD